MTTKPTICSLFGSSVWPLFGSFQQTLKLVDMDKSSYKSARRMLILRNLANLAEALYGIRKVATDEADFADTLAEMMSDEDNMVDFNPEENDE